MNPLRIFLLAALVLVVFGIGNAEADDWEPSLEHVGSYETGDRVAQDVIISGDYAYLVGYAEGLIIINIEDPTNPTFVSSYSTGGSAIRLTISGNYAYVSTWNNGLIIVDIEDPTSPTFVSSYHMDYTWDVTILGNYAYVTDQQEGLIILDIEDPATPTFVGNYSSITNWAHGVAISGDFAYVAAGDLFIFNVEDPTNPTLAGTYDGLDVYDLTISGNYGYIANRCQECNGFQIIDIEDATNPFLVGNYTTTSVVQSVSVSGYYAYIVAADLVVLNVEDPTNPIFVTELDLGNAFGSFVLENYVYVADFSEGLILLDFGYSPRATIDTVHPSPARFDDDILFSSSSEDYDGIVVTYEWHSSLDGFLSNYRNFSANLVAGIHNVSFRVQDDGDRWSDYHNITLVVYPNFFPISFIDSIYPSPSEKRTTVFFNATSSDSDGTIVSYLWESSIDGELSTEENFSSNTLSFGIHIVTFTVQDNDGGLTITNQTLWIYTVPIAIAGQNATGTPGVPLQFSGAGTDEDGTIAKYEWDFDGDGIFEWSSAENGRELNIYNNEGTYTATLRVTDNDGFTATDTVTVIISEKTIQIDDDGNVLVEDAGEDDEGIPSVSLITSLILIGLLAIFRRK